MHGIFCRFFLDDFYKDRRAACGDGGTKSNIKKMEKNEKVVDKQKERWYYKPRC